MAHHDFAQELARATARQGADVNELLTEAPLRDVISYMKAFKACVDHFDEYHKHRLAFSIQRALCYQTRGLTTFPLHEMLNDPDIPCTFGLLEDSHDETAMSNTKNENAQESVEPVNTNESNGDHGGDSNNNSSAILLNGDQHSTGEPLTSEAPVPQPHCTDTEAGFSSSNANSNDAVTQEAGDSAAMTSDSNSNSNSANNTKQNMLNAAQQPRDSTVHRFNDGDAFITHVGNHGASQDGLLQHAPRPAGNLELSGNDADYLATMAPQFRMDGLGNTTNDAAARAAGGQKLMAMLQQNVPVMSPQAVSTDLQNVAVGRPFLSHGGYYQYPPSPSPSMRNVAPQYQAPFFVRPSPMAQYASSDPVITPGVPTYAAHPRFAEQAHNMGPQAMHHYMQQMWDQMCFQNAAANLSNSQYSSPAGHHQLTPMTPPRQLPSPARTPHNQRTPQKQRQRVEPTARRRMRTPVAAQQIPQLVSTTPPRKSGPNLGASHDVQYHQHLQASHEHGYHCTLQNTRLNCGPNGVHNLHDQQNLGTQMTSPHEPPIHPSNFRFNGKFSSSGSIPAAVPHQQQSFKQRRAWTISDPTVIGAHETTTNNIIDADCYPVAKGSSNTYHVDNAHANSREIHGKGSNKRKKRPAEETRGTKRQKNDIQSQGSVQSENPDLEKHALSDKFSNVDADTSQDKVMNMNDSNVENVTKSTPSTVGQQTESLDDQKSRNLDWADLFGPDITSKSSLDGDENAITGNGTSVAIDWNELFDEENQLNEDAFMRLLQDELAKDEALAAASQLADGIDTTNTTPSIVTSATGPTQSEETSATVMDTNILSSQQEQSAPVNIASDANAQSDDLMGETFNSDPNTVNVAVTTIKSADIRMCNCEKCGRIGSEHTCCLDAIDRGQHPDAISLLQPMIRHNNTVYDCSQKTDEHSLGRSVCALYPELIGMPFKVIFQDEKRSTFFGTISILPDHLRFVASITVFNNGMEFFNDPLGSVELLHTGNVLADAPEGMHETALYAYRSYWDKPHANAVIGHEEAVYQGLLATYNDEEFSKGVDDNRAAMTERLEKRSLSALKHQPGSGHTCDIGSNAYLVNNARLTPQALDAEQIDIYRALNLNNALNSYDDDNFALTAIPNNLRDMKARSMMTVAQIVRLMKRKDILKRIPDAQHHCRDGARRSSIPYSSKILVILALEMRRVPRRPQREVDRTLRRLVKHFDEYKHHEGLLNRWREQLMLDNCGLELHWILRIMVNQDFRVAKLLGMLASNDPRLFDCDRDDEIDSLGLFLTLEDMLRKAASCDKNGSLSAPAHMEYRGSETLGNTQIKDPSRIFRRLDANPVSGLPTYTTDLSR